MRTIAYFTLKLDMSKAYDQVEWGFLKCMILHMSFSNTWVDFIVNCISTITYSVVLNDDVNRWFSPSRGL